jgi:hypothetical protein
MLIIKGRDILITKGYCYRTKNERVSIDIKKYGCINEFKLKY